MNNKCKFLIVLSLIFLASTIQVQAEKYKGAIVKKSPKANANCNPPARSTELAFNGVRAYLKTNGTMWFRELAEYEVPKGTGKTSLFSASLWVAGMYKDNLYVAAMRFGQVGNDYYTGPLSMVTASIEQASCSFYDKFYRISRTEVVRHIALQGIDPTYQAPKSITDWPAHGRSDLFKESYYLAPFHDLNNNGQYDWEAGEYPYYDLENELCPWTEANKEKAKIPYWIDLGGGKVMPNDSALPMPHERRYTRMEEDEQGRFLYGWDNQMIYADHVLKGDETIYWFLNDAGGPHTETEGRVIGLEIRMQAFAFATNDELNKMTFYSYEIINRGSIELKDCYFSQWCDPDLGYADDDFVGCDVIRGLGYCYNGENEDGNGQLWAYGKNPPAVGFDFFQGPYIDPDGSDNPKFNKDLADISSPDAEKQEYCRKFVHHIFDYWNNGAPDLLSDTHPSQTLVVENKDQHGVITYDTVPIRWNNQFAINGVNFGDGIADNERFGMRAFTYHDNEGGAKGDPRVALEYYRYLRGFWADGMPFTYGGSGYATGSGTPCKFVFPEGTDYCNWGTEGVTPDGYGGGGQSGFWSESSEGNKAKDRRFMQSAGPFTLKQGACNYVTVGVPWARATQGGPNASIVLLKIADDKCQALFENCFKLLDGPDAPTLTIREYDRKLIMLLTNSELSNNYQEGYQEIDITIPEEIKPWLLKEDMDRTYRFEGYQIYQVTGPGVGANDLENTDLARLVQQYDIENVVDKDNPNQGNPIGRLINWEFNEDLGLSVPIEKVNGSNTGIEHSFEVTTDLFAAGDRQLVNYKTYYYVAVAYAYNEFYPYSTSVDDQDSLHKGLQGQKLPYLRGRKTAEGGSVIPIKGIPHPPTTHGGGTTLNSDYGSIPIITRLDGQGNGGIAIDLSKETIDKILAGGDDGKYRARELTYEKDAGPIGVKVIDPLRLKPFDYLLMIKNPLFDMDSIIINDEKVPVPQEMLDRADVEDNAYWVLSIAENITDEEIIAADFVDVDGKPIREVVLDSARTIGVKYEQIIIPLGLSITLKNENFNTTDGNTKAFWNKILRMYDNDMYRIKTAFLQPNKIDVANDIIFENSGYPWITGLVDDNIDLPSNWIRAGNRNTGAWDNSNQIQTINDFVLVRNEDFFFPSKCFVPDEGQNITIRSDRAFKDYSGKFGTICGGTWAPYVLTSPYYGAPQAKYTVPEKPDPYDNRQEISPRPTKDSEYPWWSTLANGVNPPQSPRNTDRDGLGLFNYYKFEDLTDFRNQPGYNQTMINLYSVNVVITPNKDLWTRCIVLEACGDPQYSEGGALKNEPRKHTSVDKDGKDDLTSKDGFGSNGTEGMGWFPGYAINMETGERLNIMFSENSDTRFKEKEFYDHVHGNDMLFNPTSTYAIATSENDPETDPYFNFKINSGTVIPKSLYDMYYSAPYWDPTDETVKLLGDVFERDYGIERVWGGMHYIYVCGSSGNTSPAYYLTNDRDITRYLPDNFLPNARRNFNLRDDAFTIKPINDGPVPPPAYDPIEYGGVFGAKNYPYYDCGPYDKGEWLVQKFKTFLNLPVDEYFIRERKHKKMQLFNNVMYTHIPMQPDDPTLKEQWMSCDVTYKIRVTRPYLRYTSRWYETVEDRNSDFPGNYPNNNGFPVYGISAKELAPTFNDTRLYQSILDNINIVPNPYYASSFYESGALETYVKITNLPTDLKNGAPVTINIFTVNGTLIRTLTKGDSETSYVDWDLKNHAKIPIASGVYIIHVNCPGIGERMLKFFCVMRQTDLNQF